MPWRAGAGSFCVDMRAADRPHDDPDPDEPVAAAAVLERLREGRILEHQRYDDLGGILTQLEVAS
jgi:hypothetical protein